MSDLLSQAVKNQFFSAIKNVTDTFYKNPVTLRINVASFDPFEETRAHSVTEYELLCRATSPPGDSANVVEETPEGVRNFEVKEFRFNAQDLRDANVMTDNNPLFIAEKDSFLYNGEDWKLRRVHFDDTDFPDSDSSGKVTIVVAVCRKEIKKA